MFIFHWASISPGRFTSGAAYLLHTNWGSHDSLQLFIQFLLFHHHLKSSNPTETLNSHLFKSATQKSQERSSRAPFASKMFSNDLRIPLVCSRACNDSSTSSSTSWAFSRMYSNLLSCAMKPLDILGLPEDLGPSRVSCPYHGWEFEPHNSRSCRYPLVN